MAAGINTQPLTVATREGVSNPGNGVGIIFPGKIEVLKVGVWAFGAPTDEVAVRVARYTPPATLDPILLDDFVIPAGANSPGGTFDPAVVYRRPDWEHGVVFEPGAILYAFALDGDLADLSFGVWYRDF